jgi:hypothetical protein
MKHIQGTAETDAAVAAFVAVLRDVPAVSPDVERRHVAAAAAAAVEQPACATARDRRFRRPLILRRSPSMSLSALAALFAGLPAKAAAATLVASATVGGVAATGNLPTQAAPGLERASEEAGFTVPVGRSAADEKADEAAARKDAAAQRRAAARKDAAAQRRAEARDNAAAAAATAVQSLKGAQAAERKAEALDAAEEASAAAGANNDEGLARARAGAANADAAGANAPAGPPASAVPPAAGSQSGARQEGAAERGTQARTKAGGREDAARDEAADESTDASTGGAVAEDEARAEAATREEAGRSKAPVTP